MMTKTNTNKKSSTMARVALGATAMLALAGRVHAVPTFAAASNGGGCAGLLFDPTSGALDADGVDAGGTFLSGAVATVAGTETGFADCETKPGFYLGVVATGANDGAGLVVSRAPAGWFAVGGQDLTTGTVQVVLPAALAAGQDGATITKCPTQTNSVAASSALSGCTLNGGYYISTKATSTTDKTSFVATQVPANYYAVAGTIQASSQSAWDGTTASTATANGVSACPANTAVAGVGSDSVEDCLLANGYYLSTIGVDKKTAGTVTQVPQNFYLASGANAASEHLTYGQINACPYGGTTTAAGQTALGSCTPSCSGAVGAEVSANSCRCSANYWGTPVDSAGLSGVGAGAAVSGCTKCPDNFSSTAGSNSVRNNCARVVLQSAYATIFTDPDHATTGMAAAVPALTDVFMTASSAGTSITVSLCPEGMNSDWDWSVALSGGGLTSFCNKITANYYGYPGSASGNSHATTDGAATAGVTACPANSVVSGSASAVIYNKDCKCKAGYSAQAGADCLQCPANTYRAGGDSVVTSTNCLGCASGYTSAAGASSCTAIVVSGTNTPVATPEAEATKSGATGVSLLAAVSVVAAAQLVF